MWLNVRKKSSYKEFHIEFVFTLTVRRRSMKGIPSLEGENST